MEHPHPNPPYKPRNNNENNGNGENVNHRQLPISSDPNHSCGSCCWSVSTPASSDSGKNLNTFYKKQILISNVDGMNSIKVASSAEVSDPALLQAALTLVKLSVKRPDLLNILYNENVHLAVLGVDETTTDIPEYAPWTSLDWARGLGATSSTPVVSCGTYQQNCFFYQ